MRVRVVLVGVEGAVNLGFIARTCMNFGVEELYLVNPVASIEEALRYAAKAADFLRKARILDSLPEALKGVDLVAATTAKGYSVGDALRQAVPLREFVDMIRGRVEHLAVVFGRESTGLTRAELELADVLVTIPADPRYPVLNLSQAVAVVLWELWSSKESLAQNVPPRADRREVEEILGLIDNVSSIVLGHEDKVKRLHEVWKKVLWRSSLSMYEARLIKYWLRRISSRLTSDE